MPGKDDLSDPTWQYIVAALDRGRSLARARGLKWKGDSCFTADAAALGLVADTRDGFKIWGKGDGGPTLKTDNPQDIHLAYADHYLETRTVTALFGIIGYSVMTLDNVVYNKIKSVVQAMQKAGDVSTPPTPDGAMTVMWVRTLFGPIAALGDRLEKSLRENPNNPTSNATKESIYWGNVGNSDGLNDDGI